MSGGSAIVYVVSGIGGRRTAVLKEKMLSSRSDRGLRTPAMRTVFASGERSFAVGGSTRSESPCEGLADPLWPAGPARRFLEQQPEEHASSQPQQERHNEPQQQHRFARRQYILIPEPERSRPNRVSLRVSRIRHDEGTGCSGDLSADGAGLGPRGTTGACFRTVQWLPFSPIFFVKVIV